MFFPPVIWARHIPGITKEELDKPSHCMCEHLRDVRLCMAVWTHLSDEDTYKWFLACHAGCITTHVSCGSC